MKTQFDRFKQFLESRFPSGSLVRNVSMLSGGTLFAQGLTVLVLPILTRLYSPEDFTVLAVYAALLGIITTVTCLRFNLALPIPKSDDDGMALLMAGLAAALFFTVLAIIPFVLLSVETANLLNRPSIASYLWLVVPGILFASVYDLLQFWSSRKKRFALVTQTRIERSVGMSLTQLLFGLLAASPLGLIIGQVVYSATGIVRLAKGVFTQDQETLSAQSVNSVREQAVKYKGFAIYSTPEALFNSAGIQVPILIIAAVVAGPEAGFVMLAMRIMGLPMTLVGSSVAQVYLSEAAELDRKGELAAATRKIMWTLFKLGGPLLIAVGALSPFLFPIVFGSEWARAGIIVAWMTPWFVLQFVTSPISSLLHVRGFLKEALVLQIIGFVLRVGAVLLSAAAGAGMITEVYALSGLVFYALYMVVVLRKISTP